jgi:serine phosphatase RsbU (regulator of sigma subunit)
MNFKNLMNFSLIIVYLLSFIVANGQNRQLDSLNNLLKTTKDDTSRMALMCTIGEKLWRTGNFDSAVTVAQHIEEMAKKLELSPDTKIQLSAKTNLAYAYKIQGIVYRHHGNFSKALDYELNALQLDVETGNRNAQAALLGNIGVVYWNTLNYDKALEYFQKALDLATQMGNNSVMAANIGNIGIIYREQNNYPKALEYYQKAMDIQQQLGDRQGVATNLGNMGVVFSYLKDYPKSLDYSLKALSIGRQLNDLTEVGINLSSIGHTYYKMGKYTLARAYMDSGLAITRKIGDRDETRNIYLNRYVLDSAEHDYNKEAEDLKMFMHIRDTINDEATEKKTMQAELNFQFEKKQEIAKAEQDKKDALAEKDKKREAIVRNAFIAGFLLMIALAFFIFRGYRQKQKANTIITAQKKEVEEQKAIVDEKNKDITDSIKYASRIQHALLTTEDYISKHLKDYFILFKPRDIVSGDFYWAFIPQEKADSGEVIMAACDCTGHGVPGAFMSLLNISMLNEAVVERKISRPDQVLNAIRANVIKALNPDGKSETKDGMDCALISLDLQKNTILAACANNPVLIIRGNDCIEMPADNMPVGIQDSEIKPFTLNTFNLQKGDCIYLFTDGYADQFGGPKGKKLKHKYFQQLLVDNAHLPMKEQKKVLEKAFEDWKGILEQTDDVCVIGIRV